MVLHPAVIASLVSSTVICGTVFYATCHAWQILRRWNLSSGEEIQLVLEHKTYLISTIISFVFIMELMSLFLFVFTANMLCPLFVGAMCAAGTFNVNAFGYPALLLKILNSILAGIWLIFNYADNKAYDYPLIKKKYVFLVAIAPLIFAETVLQFMYFLNLHADTITSCCGRLFSGEHRAGVASHLINLPRVPMMWAYFSILVWTLFVGTYAYIKKKGGYIYSVSAQVLFVTSIMAIISFVSIYIYELPTHHCPFCILASEYHFIGYVMYLLLFLGVVTGGAVAFLLPYRKVNSLRKVIPSLTDRLLLFSLASFAAWAVIVIREILSSKLIL